MKLVQLFVVSFLEISYQANSEWFIGVVYMFTVNSTRIEINLWDFGADICVSSPTPRRIWSFFGLIISSYFSLESRGRRYNLWLSLCFSFFPNLFYCNETSRFYLLILSKRCICVCFCKYHSCENHRYGSKWKAIFFYVSCI